MTDEAVNNLAIWDKLGKTDPKHTKGFKRAGGFSGTAIKPIYTTQKMTEVFGPAGKGWGMGEPSFQIVPGVSQEVLVYCTVMLWWTEGDKRCEVFGVGGDKCITHIKANEQYNRPERWENDDEAYKKAFTDALSNAMKHIGMSADVHMGLFDDSKYVSELRNGMAEATRADNAPAAPAQVSSYLAKKFFKTDELLADIDNAKTSKRCDELDAMMTAELAFLPGKWIEAFRERIAQRRTELGASDDERTSQAESANAALDRQFSETIGK